MGPDIGLTDNIVSILITHETKKRALTTVVWRGECGYDINTLVLSTELDALLDHITCEFVLRVCQQLAHDDVDHAGAIRLIAVLNDMLDDVISKLIRDQVGGAGVELSHDGLSVDLFAVLEHSLDDTAAIWMGCQSVDLATEGINDELNVLGRNALNRFLDDVVPILVTNALEDMVLKFLDHGSLLVGENVLQCLLDNPTAVHLS